MLHIASSSKRPQHIAGLQYNACVGWSLYSKKEYRKLYVFMYSMRVMLHEGQSERAKCGARGVNVISVQRV
jgi:hypothetical protein